MAGSSHLVNPAVSAEVIPLRVESAGAWPFVSRYALHWANGRQRELLSRHHRKGLGLAKNADSWWSCLWMPDQLNWWIGITFALGAVLFILGCVLVLSPTLVAAWSITPSAANAVFFAGSIPFTTAAYLQLFQAANAGAFTSAASLPMPVQFFAWRPREVGWLSSFLQFAGTLLFNINTFEGMRTDLGWLQQDMVIWAPDFFGSILFLLSGYLAFIETCHAHWAWQPASLSWWVTWINLLGCIAFMVSAVFALVLPGVAGVEAAQIATVFTLLGGVCFFFGSLLMLPETALHRQGSGATR